MLKNFFWQKDSKHLYQMNIFSIYKKMADFLSLLTQSYFQKFYKKDLILAFFQNKILKISCCMGSPDCVSL
jgi:hypothetical protein